MGIEAEIVKKVIADMDLSSYEKEINKAVSEFFKSDNFGEILSDCFYDEGVGYELALALSKKVKPLLSKKIKVSLG